MRKLTILSLTTILCAGCAMHTVMARGEGDYELTITRIWDHSLNALNVDNPMYPDDDEYVDVEDGTRYAVTFTGNTVELIDQGSGDTIVGELQSSSGAVDTYSLDLMPTVELRLEWSGEVAWATFTYNGSGIPIIGSEQGELRPVE